MSNIFKYECIVCWEIHNFYPETFLCFTCLKPVCITCNRTIKKSINVEKNCPVCKSKRITTYTQMYNIIKNIDFEQKIKKLAFNYDFFVYDKIAIFAYNNNKELALKCMKYSASKDYPPAQMRLGFFILKNFKNQLNEAIEHLLAAGARGVAMACYQLGNIYFEQNKYELAQLWYLKASKKEYIKAYEMLYILYSIQKNKEKDKRDIYPKLIAYNKLPSKIKVWLISNKIIKPYAIEKFENEN